ncbi:MAG: hypothetical protein RRZ24_03520 [Clostridia bacterium]
MNKAIMKQLVAGLLAFLICCMVLPMQTLAVPLSTDTDIRVVNQSDQDKAEPKECYAIAAAAPGGKVTLFIPVKNYGEKEITDLNCTIETSTNVEEFPFVLGSQTPQLLTDAYGKWDATNKTKVAWSDGKLAKGETGYFKLPEQTLLTNATGGHKDLVFTVTYKKDGDPAIQTNNLNVRFDIALPKPTSEPKPTNVPTSGGGSGFRSKPKVIIQSYSFSAEKLYAGETFTLSVVLRNTSPKEKVQNLQVSFSNANGVITPASGGSNSIYVGELEKNGVCTEVLNLQIAPDAEGKAQSLDFDITYEGTRNRAEFSTKTSVTVPVLQKIRVRCDSPVVYDEAWVGQNVNMSVQMFNLGKSTLYNCMVEIIGSGLSLEETYYGGNIASGGTMRADLTVNTAESGEIKGNIRITYEDVYGDPNEEMLPFTLNVNEEMSVEPLPTDGENPGGTETMGTGGGGIAWYIWVLGAAVVLVLIAIIIVKAKQRRARELEDI